MLNEFLKEYNEAILKHKLILKINPNEIRLIYEIFQEMHNFLK